MLARLLALIVSIGLLGGLTSSVARAENTPWAAGVSEADQSAALALYREGNKFFEESAYKDAYARYEKALASWKHPAIHYNAAVCLINLDKPVEAFAHLEAALAFGEAPLGPDLHKQALIYQKMLTSQLAVLEVSCRDADAKVTLDGGELVACPGSAMRRLEPGKHALVATKPRYETDSRSIDLPPGQKTVVVFELKLLATPKRQTRRWNRWLPWGVVGAGTLVAVAGFPLLSLAGNDIDAFDRYVDEHCRDAPCFPAQDPAAAAALDRRDAGERKQQLAIGAFAVGGAIATAGIVMVVLNQPRLVSTVTPTVGADHASLTISGRW